MNASEVLEGREGNVGDVSSKIDLAMAANTKESKEINNNNYESCVDGNDIAKKGAEIIPNIDIEDNIEQERWNGKGEISAKVKNTNRTECWQEIPVMTELERMKW
jgi:hypothetical protein